MLNKPTQSANNKAIPSPTALNYPARKYPQCTAAYHGLVSCRCCAKLAPISHTRCSRCHSTLEVRTKNSIQRTLALIVASIIFYIPANIYPIMTTTLLSNAESGTIIGGVLLFLEHESYFIAAIIFSASLMIPTAKIIIILWLCYTTSRPSNLSALELTRLYRVTTFIGKWSMIDVFVVTILVALVQFTGIMSVQPGIASQAFATVVILTMLAAHQFDVRLMWDKQLQK